MNRSAELGQGFKREDVNTFVFYLLCLLSANQPKNVKDTPACLFDPFLLVVKKNLCFPHCYSTVTPVTLQTLCKANRG